MKNLHLISTEKPSRLYYKDDNYKLANSTMAMDWYISSAGYKPTNIYIISDEEIKKKDYVVVSCSEIKIEEVRSIKDYYNEQFLFEDGSQIHIDYCKKIILTTDPDLIKDGIQTIDDDFLKWFVENPNCRYVDQRLIWDEEKLTSIYKIIIPEKEPKQDLEKEIFELEQELDIPSHLRWHNSKPKQKTLEEAAANLADPNLCKTDNWIAGAKWQQERMYEIMDLYADDVMGGCTLRAKEWFEKNKKK
jgi:hypothetical protein